MENNKPIENTLLAQNVVYCTTLYLAAQHGHKDIVKYISELPIDTVGKGLSEFTKIFLGAQNGRFEEVKLAIEKMFTLNEDDSNDTTSSEEEEESVSSCSTIHEAAEFGAENRIKSFIASGVNIDAENDEGFTPLQVATKNGKSKCIEVLIQKGASINYKIKDDNVNESNRRKTALHIACEYGRFRVVSKLLSHGADPEVKDVKGNVPLYYAVRHGSKCIVQLLLNKGININTLNNDENMVITEARTENVINLLLKNGINYKSINKHGHSILHNAAYFDNDFLVNFLLEKKIEIDIEHKSNRGNSPLLYAAYFNNCNVMKVLLQYGANINSINKTGKNALHVGAGKGATEAVNLLLKIGLNVNATTRTTKQTPLILAAIENKVDTIKLLLLHEADVTINDAKDKSALDYAIKNKNKKIIEMLSKQLVLQHT